MRQVPIIFLMFISAFTYAQTITVNINITEEIKISKGNFAIHLYNFANERMPQTAIDKFQMLEPRFLISFLESESISFKYISNSNETKTSETLSVYLIEISKEDVLEKLTNFLIDFDNDNLVLVNYELDQSDTISKRLLELAISKARFKANQLAYDLGREIDQIENIKLIYDNLYNRDNATLSANLNELEGWTAYPPLPSLDLDNVNPTGKFSIYVNQQYEITYQTKKID